jgi:hypothetical protein
MLYRDSVKNAMLYRYSIKKGPNAITTALKNGKKGPNAVATALETAKCYTGIAFEPQQKDGRKWQKQW